MKILMVNKFHFVKGGSERHYFDLSENLKKHGHEVIHFSMHHPNNEKTPEEKYFTDFVQTEKIAFNLAGIKSILKLWWNFDAAKKIDPLIQKEKPDLVHLHNISHQISPSILPKIKKHHLPIIMTMHDYKLVCPNGKMFAKGRVCEKCQGQKYFNCVRNKCVKNSYLASLATYLEMTLHHKILNVYKKNIDIFIAPSEFLKNKMIAWDWPPEKIVHLPYFIKTLKHENIKTNTNNKEDYILYFGRLSQEKGIDTLIEAMKNLPEVKLKIVGAGPEFDHYSLLITHYSLQNIEIVGYKSGAELTEIIANAKFIIVPSIWYENYPLSVLESYALGVPALVANIGGLPEMISDNDKDFVFEPKNISDLTEKINFLWQNDNVVAEAGERVKNFVKENNDPEIYYQKIMTLYQNLK